MTTPRPTYDCDTSPYWCSNDEYQDFTTTFGHFIEQGRAYHIKQKQTPRPWLNYLCNEKFASCISNTGRGFTWIHSSLLRITKYEHEIDYLPREFQDGREIILTDLSSGESWNGFLDAENVDCIHRPGCTRLEAVHKNLKVTLEVFVPLEDSGECWLVSIENLSDTPQKIRLQLGQTWTLSLFGIHTAEEGIPYLSTPGRNLNIQSGSGYIDAYTTNPELPVPIYGTFFSPNAMDTEVIDHHEHRKDGRHFCFKECRLSKDVVIPALGGDNFQVFSGADTKEEFLDLIKSKYKSPDSFVCEKERVKEERNSVDQQASCEIPEKNVEMFLNIWLKNQLYLTFRFVRSGYFGFRDTLQDTWGYLLLDPEISRRFLLRTLSHVRRDGVCPRNYSIVDESHDLRAFMDSGTWIPLALTEYIKETGEVEILDEKIRWLDSEEKAPVIDHVMAALNLLFEKRGRFGLCETGDGDWNDALEGISRSGRAVSAWLTMALFHAQNLMAELFAALGDKVQEQLMMSRSAELKQCLNDHAWDGRWYVYGFTGSGTPIGSHQNREGKIHLNAQTWAIFTGLADQERTETLRQSIHQHLSTNYGPALLSPPYVEEADEVGRIAKLEPGTFENGSVYMHAVAFSIYADLTAGYGDAALKTFSDLLPTNPKNPDSRRTSEPYCTGNYYCGPTHPRYGQNFFTWFTGNAAWLLRAGFDHLLGVQADYTGMNIHPCVPSSWKDFSVRRCYRGQQYEFQFTRHHIKKAIYIDGVEFPSMFIPAPKEVSDSVIHVTVHY